MDAGELPGAHTHGPVRGRAARHSRAVSPAHRAGREMADVLTPVERWVYELLLEGQPRSVVELCGLSADPEDAVTAAVTTLEARTLLVRLPGEPARYDVRHPQEGFAPMLSSQQARLRELTVLMDAYGQRYASSRRSSMSLDVVEVLTDTAEVAHRYQRMQQMAEHDFRACDRPPYVTDPDEVDGVPRRLAGVRYRVISDTRSRAFRHPSVWEQWAAAGQETREMADVPLKLLIADDRMALIVLDGQDEQIRSTLVVHPSLLLNGLVAVFESLWKTAAPRDPLVAASEGEDPGLSVDDQELLSMMAAGVTDVVIARRLGMSPRTLQRRIHELMKRVGAGNRFQAGLWAARRGWL